MSSIQETLRDDPAGSAIVGLLVATITLLGVQMYVNGLNWRTWFAPVAPEPPHEWRAKALDVDVLDVPGLPVAYWGSPRATYGIRATRTQQPFKGLVFHYTEDRPAVKFIEYQHGGDDRRGGSFGYHFLCDKYGRAFQAAPLSKRTNHIKPHGHKSRKPAGRELDNRNAVSVSMVGGCWRDPRKLKPITASCDGERLTTAQRICGMAIARAIVDRYGIPRTEIFGHGDLQHDRSDFEGSTLTAELRAALEPPKEKAPEPEPWSFMSLGGPN